MVIGLKRLVDEQKISFQGNYSENLRITYKAEGGGFKSDYIYDNGFTYPFYFINEPALKKCIE